MDQGMTPLEAYQETSIQVAMPGTSEHATGLAVDIISTEYDELDERQGDTDEQKWLMEHCQEYGFILRYPSDKSDITGSSMSRGITGMSAKKRRRRSWNRDSRWKSTFCPDPAGILSTRITAERMIVNKGEAINT